MNLNSAKNLVHRPPRAYKDSLVDNGFGHDYIRLRLNDLLSKLRIRIKVLA
jgi:hypothetical protein